MMKIYRISISLVAKERKTIESLLPQERLEKAAAYRLEEDQLRSLGAGYLLWLYTSPAPLTYGLYQKPEKAGEFFNLSHAGNYAVLVVDDTPVGIDIECIRPFSKVWEEKAFTAEEKQNIHAESDFFLLWTRKESIGKASGYGLRKGVLSLPSKDGVNEYEGKTYLTHSCQEGDYFLSVSHLGTKEFALDIEDVKKVTTYRSD
ncbi:MAG: 4'-phosphopantetheinyl transferase superfamily protein [Erysipelotrichaceae bacterium]|nr:4'-phosphopantetheinyl transferase superfamily protein [Erysipelotrichaceae bacterium]